MPEFDYKLVSFKLCPFVQRSVMTLEEKGVPYEIEYIDLLNKPDWFLAISPLGKVPVLRVGETAIFESAVINEFIEETTGGGLHPSDPIRKAHNRSWIEFASTMLFDGYKVEAVPSKEAAFEAAAVVRGRLARFEEQVRGPLFNGEDFSLVDAAVGPGLQRLSWYQREVPELDFFSETPRVRAWMEALFARPSFQRSTVADIDDEFRRYQAIKIERAESPEKASWFARAMLS